jgi:tetratricopeptide (TPR) repeat protein
MELIPAVGLDECSMPDKGCRLSAAATAQRLVELSNWMMALGTIRVLCTIAGEVRAVQEMARGAPVSLRLLGRFFQDNHLIASLCAAWPLLLGIALRRTRWPELLKASAATFLILSFGGFIELTAEWNLARARWLTIGSFHVSRGVLLHPTLTGAVLSVLGVSQLILEGTTAVRALVLGTQFRAAPASGDSRERRSRKARFGRLAMYVSAAYLVVMIRPSLWSAYLGLLNESSSVREFLLQNDFKRMHTVHTVTRGSIGGQLGDLDELTRLGMIAWDRNQFAAARDHYLKAIALADSTNDASSQPGLRANLSTSLNNLAWLLATCPDTTLREPERAVKNARRAVEIAPQNGDWWNTLGVACYRAGQWEEARKALYRSMELRNEGDSMDWFFLALVHLKLGHPERARVWYDKAVAWIRRIETEHPYRYQYNGDELHRFHLEAAQELGLPRPAGPAPPGASPTPPFRPHGGPFPNRRFGTRFTEASPAPRAK